MNEARQIGKVKDKPDVGQTAGGVTECDQMAVACGTKLDNDKLEVGRTTAVVCDCDEMAGACGVKVNMEDNIIDISDDDIELRVRVFLACSIFILVVYSITAAHHDAFVYYFSLAIAKKIIIR